MELVFAIVAILSGIAALFAIFAGIAVAWRWWTQRRAAPPPTAETTTSLPHLPPRNPNFTGREEELENLRASLLDGGTAALTQAITGLGGVGKTQLAIEYAHRHRDDYEVIWWVRAEEPAQLADDFGALAKALDLPEKDATDQSAIRDAVCRWLESNGGWLLVFDNVPHPKSLDGYRPGGGKGHLIITSRDPNWAGVARPLLVEVWPPEESLEFLDKRLGRKDDAARDLAEELGHLPLALAQAAAYITNSGTSLENYLTLYRQRREELWKDEKPPGEYPETVGTTWSMAFEAAAKKEPAAADLLNLLAFLAPDDIPRDLFAKGAEHLPDSLSEAVKDEIVLNRAIAALRHYSLITAEGDALSLHRLVQAVTRDRLSDEERGKWAGAAVRLLNAAFPFKDEDPATWPESGRLLPHGLTATGHGEKLGAQLATVAKLYDHAGSYLEIRAEFDAAKAASERAVAIGEETHGRDDPTVAPYVNNLGYVLRRLGDLEGAKKHFERALTIDEKVHGPDHPNVAIRVNNLGLVLKDMGDLEAAKRHYVRALAIFEKAYGEEHPRVAAAANNLGDVLREMGDLKGAKEHFERALTIDEKVHGPDHPDVAVDVSNLGSVLREMGDPQGAKEHYQRALTIDEKVYGPDHPDVATDVNNLGRALQDMGDLEGAKEHYERALAIDEKVYGPDHPEVARDVNNLGDVLYDMADLTGAKEHLERALAIDEKVYGRDHPDVAADVNNLGNVLREMGDLEGAKKRFERALAIDEKAYGPDHPEVARDVNNLGNVLRDMGDLKGAKEHLERALAICLKFLGEDHPKTQLVRRSLEALDEGEGS